MRLDKALTLLGMTRTEAKKAIAAGRVKVHGEAARDPGLHVEPEEVALDGRALDAPEEIYYMLNKPAGVLTATEDRRGAKTALDLLPEPVRRRAPGPVGRLDKDVTGLVLMTTDGQLAHRLISPRWTVEKVYLAEVEGEPDEADAQRLREGVAFKDFTARPAGVKLHGGGLIELTLTEGKFHEVKRLLAAVGHPVARLKRLSIGGVELDEGLAEGESRPLTAAEVARLKALVDLSRRDVARLVFIEGVSGVGKSTMVRTLRDRLRDAGVPVRAYLEFDADNPIDFYCTAYMSRADFAALCAGYPQSAERLRARSIPAGEAVLVRYYDRDMPLFSGPLLEELTAREFCWRPSRPVSIDAYSDAMAAVWRAYAASLANAGDEVILFDGSLLFHPLNDMTRNYGASPARLAAHVQALLAALGDAKWRAYYLRANDYPAQLARARRDRGQEPPTAEALDFWTQRAADDRAVLEALGRDITALDISGGRWDEAANKILAEIMEMR